MKKKVVMKIIVHYPKLGIGGNLLSCILLCKSDISAKYQKPWAPKDVETLLNYLA